MKRDEKIKELRDTWFALQSEKEKIVKQAWELEFKQEKIRELLIKYTREDVKKQEILDTHSSDRSSTDSILL